VRQKMKNTLLGVGLLLALVFFAQGAVCLETEDCLSCHTDAELVDQDQLINQLAFSGTAHAEMGCPSCHDQVSDDHPDDGVVPGKASCGDCHDDIFTEYNATTHGEYATCNDCHDPHVARSPTQVSGYDMNRQCSACHDAKEVEESHARWLPQADLHVGTLPCVICHTASENYVVTMYLTKRQNDEPLGDFNIATVSELKKVTGTSDALAVIDTDNDNFISLSELRAFNTNPKYKKLRLLGMMTPEKITHNFMTLDSRWDCSFCHASGPDAMKVSYVAFPQEDGSFSRVAVEEGAALDALYGTPDFYMVGATRNGWVSILGLLIILGGMAMPIGHGTLRFLTRNNRKDH